MNWIAKRPGEAAQAAPAKTGGAAAAKSATAITRSSNGLKEFLSLLSDAKRGRILDLGPASQTTINFFLDRGLGISTGDLLRAWREFMSIEQERIRKTPPGTPVERTPAEILAGDFLKEGLEYPAESFVGILMWDVFDYLDPALAAGMMTKLYDMLKPGGVALALFHSKPAEKFNNYRIADGQTIELVSVPLMATQVRVFQNREIMDLFGQFRSSKTFVGRDQLREALFIK